MEINRPFHTPIPPVIDKWASFCNRRSTPFMTFQLRDLAEYSIRRKLDGVPMGGIIYEMDANRWREVWRWEAPTTCFLCQKEWTWDNKPVPLSAPEWKPWHEILYVHKDCKRPGI